MRLSSESRLESWAGWWRVIDLAGVCVYTCTVLCSACKSVRAKLVFEGTVEGEREGGRRMSVYTNECTLTLHINNKTKI